MAGMGIGPPVSETLVDAVDIPESPVRIQLNQQQTGCRVQIADENKANFVQDEIERKCKEIQDGDVATDELSILCIKTAKREFILKKPSRPETEPKSVVDSMPCSSVVGQKGDAFKRLNDRTVSKIHQDNKLSMPKTPDHYWDLDFPSLNEQLERGYIIHTNSPLFKKQCNRPKRCLFRE
uniref:DNA endonuclease RBBP8 n=1 Tax=Meloidogyne floridensis TaxID=298350 RepID=A0A915NKN4_9BILA